MTPNSGCVIKVMQDGFFLELASSGQAVGRQWAGSGQVVARQWPGSGQAVGRQWAGSGQALGRQWAGSGQAVVKVSQSKSTIKVRQVGFFQM